VEFSLESCFVIVDDTDSKLSIFSAYCFVLVTSFAFLSPETLLLQAWCSKRRMPRTTNLLYKIGNFVRHTRLQYPGVIFGWDPQFMLNDDYVVSMRVRVQQPSVLISTILFSFAYWSAMHMAFLRGVSTMM